MTRGLALLLKKFTIGLGFPAQFGHAVQFELRLLSVRLFWRFRPRNRATLRRLRGASEVRLNFGCGDAPIDDWVNVDGIWNRRAELVIGLRDRLPIASESVRFVFSEHLIEHFRYDEAVHFLSECWRILEPGGAIRVVAPDLHGMARAYVEQDKAWFDKAFPYLSDPVKVLNLVFHQGGAHHYIYDSEALQAVLREAGFERLTPSSFGRSAWPELNVDLDDDLRTIKSVYVEACK